MDAGLAEAAAFGMGFKGAGSCKCRTAYEIIVPNEEKAACFVQFHQFLVICHMSPRSFKDGGRKMARQNSRLTVLWPRDSETPVGDATDSDQLPPVSIDSIFCKRLYLFTPRLARRKHNAAYQ